MDISYKKRLSIILGFISFFGKSSLVFSASVGIILNYSESNPSLLNETKNLLYSCHLQTKNSRHEIRVLKNIPELFLLEGVDVKTAAELQKCLGNKGKVVPERKYHLEGVETIEKIKANNVLNDPDLIKEWHLNNPTGVDVQVFKGWAYLLKKNGSISTGDPKRFVSVAVIDTGINLSHPDLANIVQKNEIGAIDGWNFVDNSAIPEDDQGHGTHVSGIIAAESWNKYGIAGITPDIRIVPIKAFDSSGEAGTAVLVQAIDFAIGRKVRIINASWGQYETDELLEAAIKRISNQNILLVAAAGNDALNTDQKPHLPSSYPFPGIISVGASDKSGKPASFSNFGATSVDVFAPGTDIYSTYIGESFASKSGTSMAAPVVAGIAGAVLALDSTLGSENVKTRILDSASLPQRMFPNLAGKSLTGGIPSLVASLGGSVEENYDTEAPTAPMNITASSNAHFEAQVSWSASSDNIAISHYLISRNGSAPTVRLCCQWKDSSTEGGITYSYSIAAVDWAGNASAPLLVSVTTPRFGASQAWSAFPVYIETPHPYPISTTLTYEARVPSGYIAEKIRLHFTLFDTEEWFDKVKILDHSEKTVATYMGELGTFSSEEIMGSYGMISLISDKRNNRFGFVIDRIEAFIQ